MNSPASLGTCLRQLALHRGARMIGTALAVTIVCVLPRDSEAQSPGGTLRIKTDASQVAVFLDGKDVGTTPLTLTNIPAGQHGLTLTKPGWIDHIDTVAVVQGTVASRFVVMKRLAEPMPPLPAQFRVVHDHARGHCVGSLIVQRDSILFKADSGEDVFSIPIRSVRMVGRADGFSWGRFARTLGVAVTTGLSTGVAVVVIQVDTNSGSLVPLRVDTPTQGYSFLAFESGDKPTAMPTRNMPTATVAANNQALFGLVHRLYLQDLKVR